MVVSFPNVQGQKYTNPLKPPQNHSVDTHPPSLLPGTSHKCRPILFQEKDWLKQPSCFAIDFWRWNSQVSGWNPPNFQVEHSKLQGLGMVSRFPSYIPSYPSLPKSSGHTLWVDGLEPPKRQSHLLISSLEDLGNMDGKGRSQGEFHFACGLNQPIFRGKDAVSFREDLHPRKLRMSPENRCLKKGEILLETITWFFPAVSFQGINILRSKFPKLLS